MKTIAIVIFAALAWTASAQEEDVTAKQGYLEPANLLGEACKGWKVDRGELVSSGQRPLRWDGNEEIRVEVTAKRKAGGKLSMTVRLKVPKDGAVEVVKRP